MEPDDFLSRAKREVAPMLIQLCKVARLTTAEIELVENLLIRAYCDGALMSMNQMKSIYGKEVIKNADDK